MLTAILILILAVILVITAYAAKIGAPPVFTNKRHIRKLLANLDLKPGQIFYELGAGNGRVMTMAAAAKPDIKVIGFELSPIMLVWAWLNIKIHRLKNAEIRWRNFFHVDFRDADFIFCFLMPKTLEKMKIKFEKELKPGAKIISYAFQVNGWSPEKIIKPASQSGIYIYNKKN